MLTEIARPVTLILCIVSLYAVFCAAFLDPAGDLDRRVPLSLERLTLAAAISLASALVFRRTQAPHAPRPRVAATLPARIFGWTTAAMLILFLVSWCLKNYPVFYRDVRVF
jgi:hypothetical protein